MPGRPSYERLVAAVDRRHRAILLAALGLSLAAALSLLRLRLDMDVLAQLPSRSAAFRDYRTFLQSFGAFDSLVLLVTGAPGRVVPFTDALAPRLARIPGVGSVRYRADLDAVRARFVEPFRYQLLSDEDFDELSRRLEPEAIVERVRRLRQALAMPMSLGARRWIVMDPLGVDELVGRSLARDYADPLLRPSSDYFLSPSGDAALMMVLPTQSAFDTVFAERFLAEVRSAERELLDGPFRDVTVGHTGSYVYALADKRVLRSDLGLYFLFAPLAVLAIFHLGLRSLRILPFVTAPLLATTTITFALSLVAFGSFNMISVAFAGIFYGLGIDSAIYFYALLREKAAAPTALDRAAVRSAVCETLREIGVASLVSSTTTAVAFFVIGLSAFTGVSQLGLMTAVAMLLNVVSTFVLLPAMVFAWGARVIPPPAPPPAMVEWLARSAGGLAERRRAALGVAVALVAVSGAGVWRTRLDTDFTHLRPASAEAERVERDVRERFGHVDAQGVVMVDAGDAEEGLRVTERVAAALAGYRRDGLVHSYSALSAFLPSRETAELRLARFRSLPRAQAAAELRGALVQAGFDERAFAGFLDDLVREDRPALTLEAQQDGPLATLLERHLRPTADGVRVATFVVPAPGVPLSAIRRRLAADLSDAPLTVTGREIVEAEFAGLLRGELAWFLAASLALNFALLLLAERRLVRAAAMLLPTLVALVVYLGVIGALDVAIDPVNLVVLPLLIGLGVDDSVYLVAHMRHAGGLVAGVRRGALPLLLAVGTTVVGFGSLGLSRFPALHRLGWLAALGLSLCAAATLVLVPALERTLCGRDDGGELPCDPSP
jgi:predicted RND superfamily exporter protein